MPYQRTPRGAGVKSSRAWLLVLPALLAGLGGGGSSASASPRETEGELRVRVLLFREPSRVIIEGEGDRRVEIVAVSGGLRVNGGAPVVSWSGGGAGVLTVRGWRVRGVLRVLRTEEGLAVVNELPIEAYLAGTLAREMYAGWSSEALRAQAVASRTYALYQCRLRRRESYDVVSGTNSQVYGGLESEVPRVLAAVEATRGEILTHRGSPVLAAFHSASGGRTASAEEVWGDARPYLQSIVVDDEWDSPNTYWRVRIGGTTLGRALAALGKIRTETRWDRETSLVVNRVSILTCEHRAGPAPTVTSPVLAAGDLPTPAPGGRGGSPPHIDHHGGGSTGPAHLSSPLRTTSCHWIGMIPDSKGPSRGYLHGAPHFGDQGASASGLGVLPGARAGVPIAHSPGRCSAASVWLPAACRGP